MVCLSQAGSQGDWDACCSPTCGLSAAQCWFRLFQFDQAAPRQWCKVMKCPAPLWFDVQNLKACFARAGCGCGGLPCCSLWYGVWWSLGRRHCTVPGHLTHSRVLCKGVCLCVRVWRVLCSSTGVGSRCCPWKSAAIIAGRCPGTE